MKWEIEEWDPPPVFPRIQNRQGLLVCPYVGIPMPSYATKRHFKAAWYKTDPKFWSMLPFQRDKWYAYLVSQWAKFDYEDQDLFRDRLRSDQTPRFFAQVSALKKRGGFVCIIGGRPVIKGDGKSVLGQICSQYFSDIPPHVIWEHSDIQMTIDEAQEGKIHIIVDEDLTATGTESGNLVIEILNRWQTNRKTDIIITSIGVNPGKQSNAVDLHLLPAGINYLRQITRFAMVAQDRFVGFGALQRKFRPEDPVYYGNERGVWGEYKARAIAYSQSVIREGSIQAVPPEVERAHIDLVLDWLEQEQEGEKWTPPKMDVLVTYAKQFGLPTKTVAYPKRICSTALYEFGKKHPELGKKRTETVDFSQLEKFEPFWQDYQTVVYENYPDNYPLADRDALMITMAQMGKTYPQIQEELKLMIRVNSIGERVRKGVSEWKVLPTPTQLGTIGEKFLQSHIDSPHTPCTRSQTATKGIPDLSDTGDIATASWAVNVKVALETDFDRPFETSPEHDLIPNAWCVFLFPKLGLVSIQDIDGENTRYNSREMVLCGIEEGAAKLQELIANV